MLQKTLLIKHEDIRRSWHFLDADGIVLGRLATRIAGYLTGKGKRDLTPHVDNGDFVVVTNAAGVKLTGRKLVQKSHFRHSGYPGGVTETRFDRLLAEHPERMVREAVKGMLPKSRTRKTMLTRLRIYRDAAHRHQAQQNQGGTQ